MAGTEQALAARVVGWLQAQHWDVYQEVQPAYGEPTADIVAVNGRIIWVVETKTTLGLDVMAQAQRWSLFAHYVSVAVPAVKGPSRARTFAEQVLRQCELGLIIVGTEECWEGIAPVLHRRAFVSRLRGALREEQRTWAPAGNAMGLRFTPFQATAVGVRRYVEEHPGATIAQVLAGLEGSHHYHTESTARSCLLRWAQRGVIRGVEVRREGRGLRFFPKELA